MNPTGDQATRSRSVAAAAMRGDRSAIQSLWHEHRRWIAAVLLAYKPRAADLDDLLQEVAMTLIAKIDTIREETNVRAWLRAVAINAARAAGRTERNRPAVRLAHANMEFISADEEPKVHSEHSERVLSIVERLPDAYREPLMLKAVQGMRTRQIAELLGIPEATVDTRISRARKMLREQARLMERPMQPLTGTIVESSEEHHESRT